MLRKMGTISMTLVSLLLCLTPDVSAQTDKTANTYHVFPQVADGYASDGSSYQTSLYVHTAVSGNINCTFTMYGVPADRLGGPNQFTIASQTAGSGTIIRTTSLPQNPLATGYATLACNGPVTAQATYGYYAPDNTPIGLATVFSSQSATVAALGLDRDYRLGIAIANDTSSAASYAITVVDAGGRLIGSQTVSVNPKSNVASFVDKWVPSSAGSGGVANIQSSGGAPFTAIGLMFDGSIFTTLPATVLQ
jgi:hypothetical protein